MSRFKAALGAQDQFAELSCGTFAATGRGYAVGMFANECRGIGHCHAQTDPTNDRQVGQVITEVSDLLIA